MLRTAVTLATALLSAAAGAFDSPPVALCDNGLAPQLSVYRYADGTGWQSEDPGAASVVELGGGLYYVADLPVASGTDRYQLQLRNPVTGLVIASYSWGSQHGARIVWRQELVLPQPPLIFKVGDSGTVELEIRSGFGVEITAPGTTVTFRLYHPADDVLLVTDQPATIANLVYDEITGSWGASLLYDLGADDLTRAGVLFVASTTAEDPRRRRVPSGTVDVDRPRPTFTNPEHFMDSQSNQEPEGSPRTCAARPARWSP